MPKVSGLLTLILRTVLRNFNHSLGLILKRISLIQLNTEFSSTIKGCLDIKIKGKFFLLLIGLRALAVPKKLGPGTCRPYNDHLNIPYVNSQLYSSKSASPYPKFKILCYNRPLYILLYQHSAQATPIYTLPINSRILISL